jgi:hypothetical protein
MAWLRLVRYRILVQCLTRRGGSQTLNKKDAKLYAGAHSFYWMQLLQAKPCQMILHQAFDVVDRISLVMKDSLNASSNGPKNVSSITLDKHIVMSCLIFTMVGGGIQR